MAVPQNIPTSFVPHPSAGAKADTANFAFMTLLSGIGYLAFVFAILCAGGVFIYDRSLASELANKNTQLAKAEASLDQTTIQHLLRLSQRFSSAKTLLNGHIELSGLLALLESVTPMNVRFNSIGVVIDKTTGIATFSASGTAKNFNTLAVASDYFSTDARLKNAIFSNIAINQGGTVNFLLTANLDPKLIAYTAGASAALTPASATTTPLVAPPAPALGSTTPPLP